MNMPFKLTTLLDMRGLVLHAYHAVRQDPDGMDDTGENGDGKRITTPEKAFAALLDIYLNPLLTHSSPKEIIAVWDGGNDYRTGLYPDYKKSRANKVESMERKAARTRAIELAKQFLASLGILQLSAPGTEADDVIACLAKRLPGSKVIYTVDADLLQLSEEGEQFVSVVLKDHENHDGTYKGVPYSLVRLQKSITGDSSDYYSGVKGIGDVAWQAMVAEFDWDGMADLDKAVRTKNYAEIQEVLASGETGPAYKALGKLYEQRAEWEFWYHIAGVHPHLAFRGDPGNQRVIRPIPFLRVPSEARLRKTLEEGKALDMLMRYKHLMPTETLVTQANLGEELARLFNALPVTPFVAFDFESSDKLEWEPYQRATTSPTGYVDVLSQELAGVSFNFGENLQHTIYISFDHARTDNVPVEVLKDVIDRIVAAGIPLVVQNESFEMTVLNETFGEEWADSLPPVWDTAVMASHVDENLPAGLKDSSLHYLRYPQVSYKDTLKAAGHDHAVATLGDEFMDELQAAREVVAMRVEGVKAYQLNVKAAGEEPVKEVLADLKGKAKEAKKALDPLESRYQEVAGEVSKMCDISGEQVLSYGCDDSLCTASLAHLYLTMMAMEQTLALYFEADVDAAWVLIDGFRKGIPVDYGRLSEMEAYDKVTHTGLVARLRELLTQHCSVPGPLKANAYIDDQRQKKRIELIEKADGAYNNDRAGLEAALLEWEQGLRAATMYSPLRTEKQRADWLPTPKQLEAVFDLLFEHADPAEPVKMPSATPAGVTKFLVATEVGVYYKEGREDQGDRFLELLAGAASEIKAREGEKYTALKAFCDDLLSEALPEIQLGDELNFNSPGQMVELFYCKLGLPVRDRTKQKPDDPWKKKGFPGNPSTGDSAIEMAIVEDCPEGDWRREALRCLQGAKACATREKYYYYPWPLWQSPKDGVMHPQIRPSSTATRRPSATSPNMLQVSN